MPPRAGRTKAKAGASPRRPRGPLSREEIIKGAFELVEAESVEELSMPRLARHLGVGVTSIYWYFRSKEELLDALTEQAVRRFEELMPEFGGCSWDEHLRQYFHGASSSRTRRCAISSCCARPCRRAPCPSARPGSTGSSPRW